MKVKYVVQDENEFIVGPFKTYEEAKAYIESRAADIFSGFKAHFQFKEPTVFQNSWSDEDEFELSFHDNFEYAYRKFTWKIKILQKP